MKLKLPDIKRIEESIAQVNVKINQNALLFSFFLLLSIIFWFLDALSEKYVSQINYPVRYTSFPDNKILQNQLPNTLKLKVEAYGFDILKYKLSIAQTPVFVQVNSLPLRETDDNASIYISTNYMHQEIEKQLSAGINLIDISPDSIVFRFANQLRKKVVVRHNFSIQFKQPYLLSGKIKFEPDSILISGLAQQVKAIQYIETEAVGFENMKDSVEQTVPLKTLSGIEFSKNEVKATIPIEQFTQKEFELPIQVQNLPDNLQIKLFPQHVKLLFLVSLSNYKRIIPAYFQATVDYNLLKNNKQEKVPVKISKQTSDIQNLQIYPTEVEYIVEIK